jgi:hypothetical protein
METKVLQGLELLRSKTQGRNSTSWASSPAPLTCSDVKPKHRFFQGKKDEEDKVQIFSTEQEVPPLSAYGLEVDEQQQLSSSPGNSVPSHVNINRPTEDSRNILERFLIGCASHCLTPIAPLLFVAKTENGADGATTVSDFYEQKLERHPSIQKTASIKSTEREVSLLDEIQSAISSKQRNQGIEVDHRGRPRPSGDDTSTLSSIPNLLASLSWESIMSNEDKMKQGEGQDAVVHPLSIQPIEKGRHSLRKKESLKGRNMQVFVAQEESKRDRGMKTKPERSSSILDHLSMSKAVDFLLYPEHYSGMQRKDEMVAKEAQKPRRRLAVLRRFLRRLPQYFTCGCSEDAVDDLQMNEGSMVPKKQVTWHNCPSGEPPDECATDTDSLLTDEEGSLGTYEPTNDATIAGYSLAGNSFEPMGKFLFAAQAMVCFADEGGARDINEVLEEIIEVHKT